jgi:hypothetical protein
MGEELGNQRLYLLRRRGGVMPAGRALPELDPTKPAKMVPFQTGADTALWPATKSQESAIALDGICHFVSLAMRTSNELSVILNLHNSFRVPPCLQIPPFHRR